MHILFISTLYPSSIEPIRGIFNQSLVKALKLSKQEVQVISPVKWCPGENFIRKRVFPPYTEVVEGILITHPRFFYSPGTFIYWHYLFYRWSIKRHFLSIINEFHPDHIILCFVYPDAVALAPLCLKKGLDYSILVLGSDFRIRSTQRQFKKLVIRTLNEASLIFCAGQALKRNMILSGIESNKITSFNNGVDHNLFHT